MGTRRPGRTGAGAAGLALLMAGSLTLPSGAASAAGGPESMGRWAAPFSEPTIDGKPSSEACVEGSQSGDDHEGKHVICKPAAGSIAVVGGTDVVYWNALEDTEEVEVSIVGELGAVSINDQVRRLDVDARRWEQTSPTDGGANPDGYQSDPLFPALASDEKYNDGALFCAALTWLPDGRLLTAGGTAYYHDPAIAGKYGVSELEGLANTRIFDPATNTWTQSGDMGIGRWYPTLVPMAGGKVFVASGVKKLIKTAYPDKPLDSQRNVVQSETYDPASGTWSDNGAGGEKTLPLFPRLHLLPNGHVYFNAAGQVFNPNGQAYDEVLWNQASSYDPASKSWTDLGIPGLGTPAPGFRGSTFSVMLPLRPAADGSYSKVSFLTAGGILGTSPGTYFALKDGRIDTLSTASAGPPAMTSEATGPLNQARWYGSGVLTPTGEVVALSGASADEVVGPGTAMPVTQPEIWNPKTGRWSVLAGAAEKRTYHNTAALLPDGRILVGGHAPISTAYLNNTTLVPGVTTPQETRNPTFEIYSPPYLFRGDRPKIERAPRSIAADGRTFELELDIPASQVESVVLMRKTSITHLVDGGQRSVELPFTAGPTAQRLRVTAPPDAAVAPDGPYLLFVNRRTPSGPVPSEATELVLRGGAAVEAVAADEEPTAGPIELPIRLPIGALSTNGPEVDLSAAGAVPVDVNLAFHEIAEISGTHVDTSPPPPAASGLASIAASIASAPARGENTTWIRSSKVVAATGLLLLAAYLPTAIRRRPRRPSAA